MRETLLKSYMDWMVIFKALAEENRLKIIRELFKKDASVNNLANTLGMKIYSTSKHLKILEASGLVEKRKAGNRRVFNITEDLKSRLSDDEQVLDLGCCKFMFKYLMN